MDFWKTFWQILINGSVVSYRGLIKMNRTDKSKFILNFLILLNFIFTSKCCIRWNKFNFTHTQFIFRICLLRSSVQIKSILFSFFFERNYQVETYNNREKERKKKKIGIYIYRGLGNFSNYGLHQVRGSP